MKTTPPFPYHVPARMTMMTELMLIVRMLATEVFPYCVEAEKLQRHAELECLRGPCYLRIGKQLHERQAQINRKCMLSA